MSAIKCNVILNSVRTRRDNSLSLSLETPELTDEHMLVFLKLRNVNLDMTLEILGQTEAPLEVKSETESKTPSQRIRACLFILWKHETETGQTKDSFNDFYANRCEKIITWLKTKLPDQT